MVYGVEMLDANLRQRITTPGALSLLLLGIGALIYLPCLGTYPLWDPWEPHYTQVAWEMGERGTWLRPWYRGLDNWWSKPILLLWMLRGSLSLFWDPIQNFAHHEWAARLPFALAAIGGAILHFDWVRRLFGKWVAFGASVILLTAPMYVVIGRQVMADTPFLVTYSASIGYLMVAWFAPPSTHRNGVWGWVSRKHAIGLFWILQALSVLAKGFVPPVLAVFIIIGYAIATFRPTDYQGWLGGFSASQFVTRHLIPCLGALAAVFALGLLIRIPPLRQTELLRGLWWGGASALVVAITLSRFALVRHGSRILQRMDAWWGLPLFAAVCAPWFVYMTFQFGWPYWDEFIFYHHLGRAAGTIDKPSGTFDVYLRHLGYGLFPWSAFAPLAIASLVRRASPFRSIEDRRNLMIGLAIALPHLFFTVSGTKFAHYIFPVVPFWATAIAWALSGWTRDGFAHVRLSEPQPSVGPSVPPRHYESPSWWRGGSRGDMVVLVTVSLVTFILLSNDLIKDFRHFLRLFLYYYNRATPADFFPFVEMQVLLFPIAFVIASLLLTRWIGRRHLILMGAGAIALSCYLSWTVMPAMKNTYTFKPFLDAYSSMAKPGEPIGQFISWNQPVRSVIFLFQNRAKHLKTEQQALSFLKNPGRKFVLVNRNRLPELRRIARGEGITLATVYDEHPYARLVSDQPNPEDTRRISEHLVKSVPPGANVLQANFEGKMTLIAYTVLPRSVGRGGKVKVSMYLRAEAFMERDWRVFVHGDGPGYGGRLHSDHYPMKGLYATTEWSPGEIIEDVFEIAVPPDYGKDRFNIYIGFYDGNRRLKVQDGPHDGTNRVNLGTVHIAQD